MTHSVVHSRKMNILYDPTTALYGETACRVCLNEFETGALITQLACRHLFCIPCTSHLYTCPIDQSEILTPEEYPIPRELSLPAFMEQLSSPDLSLTQIAADYNGLIRRHVENQEEINRILKELHNVETGDSSSHSFDPPEELLDHERFPEISKRANQMFLAQQLAPYERSSGLRKFFHAYNAMRGVERQRFMQLYKEHDYSSPGLTRLRRDYKHVSYVVHYIIPASFVAITLALLVWRFGSSFSQMSFDSSFNHTGL